MQLKATKVDDGWRPQRPEDVDHLRPLRRVVLGRRPHRPRGAKHAGITLFLVPLDQPGITINAIWTMGDERTNEVFLNDVFVPDDYVVGEVNHGFQYISEALDLERFTMFTFSPIHQRFELLVEYVKTTTRDGKPLKDDPVIRQRLAQLATQLEVARGHRACASSTSPPRAAPPRPPEASEYKLFATELSKRLANASMDIAGPGASCGSRRPRPPWPAGPSRRTATP